jgi:cell shape-determining protein MreD
MMQKKTVSQTQSISLSFQGLVIGIVLVFPALLSMDIGGVYFGFNFLPVAVLYYWPRAASHTWSLLSVFLLGVFYDMASANTLGMWTLAFLVVFMVLDSTGNVKTGFGRAMVGFTMSLGLCLVIVLLIGWMSMGQLPQVGTLLLNAVATIAIFPIFYWVHNIFSYVRAPSHTLGMRE